MRLLLTTTWNMYKIYPIKFFKSDPEFPEITRFCNGVANSIVVGVALVAIKWYVPDSIVSQKVIKIGSYPFLKGCAVGALAYGLFFRKGVDD